MDYRLGAITGPVSRRLGIIFLALSATWLLAPSLAHGFLPGPNMISEYESPASLYGPLFRLGDTFAAMVLIGTALMNAAYIMRRWGRYVPQLVAVMAVLMVVDIALPVHCVLLDGVCLEQGTGVSIGHGIETVLLAATVFGLSLYLAWKRRYAYWFLAAQALAFVLAYAASRYGGEHWLFIIQASYQLLQSYWLFGLVFDVHQTAGLPLAGSAGQPARAGLPARLVRNVIAVWVALNGLLALLLSSHHIVFGRLARSLVFAANTPWLLGHTLLLGVLLLYLARQLWQGDRRAMVLVTVLLLSEVLHASLSRHGWLYVPLFGLPLLALVYYQSVFDRRGGFLGFTSRLRFIAAGLAVLVVVITIVTAAFRLYDHRAWERSPYDVGRVVRRTVLLEVSADSRDSARAVMLDRVLTLLGSSVYIWLALGIFLPRSSFRPDRTLAGQDDMLRALQTGSSSSEDYFKVWPANGKHYFQADNGAVIAYTLANGLAVALADPITPGRPEGGRQRALHHFLAHCRSNGYKSVWLVVSEAGRADYEAAGYSTVQIGSSARLDIRRFCDGTLRNKWWRWQLNRAKRSGYGYQLSLPPHSPQLLRQTKHVSDAWLERPGHREQSFAMGYYSQTYLDACRLHCLYDADGSLAAFANELPIYPGNDQTTVDLIRFRPGTEGAMPVLLARALQQLDQEGAYSYFDLGLVPLAKVDNRLAKLVKQFAASRFSSHGLAQFKNKFEPDWQPEFLAYDGDGLDLAKAFVSLNKTLEYDSAPHHGVAGSLWHQ